MRKVRMIMGTAVSIAITEPVAETDFEPVFRYLEHVDRQFSSYIPASELGRYQRGELNDATMSHAMRHVKKACESYEHSTEGYFSAYYDHSYDPSGYVKSWAIDGARHILKQQGHKTFFINIGGDVYAQSEGKKIWKIGIQDPIYNQLMVGSVSLISGAVATSGSYERGHHIFDPHTHRPTTDLVSATVVGPHIIEADVYATACLAMGVEKSLAFIEKCHDYAVLLITRDGLRSMSRNFVLEQIG